MASSPQGEWTRGLDRHALRALLGGRTLELALASELRYAEPPRLKGNAVAAVIGEVTQPPSAFEVSLEMSDDGTLTSSCSRCASMFGPCVHVGIVATDLACSEALADALLAGVETRTLAESARLLRHAMHLEHKFHGALSEWLAPLGKTAALEIAAAPLDATSAFIARGYADPMANAIAVSVRRVGERKLLSSREIVALTGGQRAEARASGRDRKILSHTADRGSGRKATFASGVFASLALEAMRLHGGVFAEGFRERLRFRPMVVRPTIKVSDPAGTPAGFEALQAVWAADDEVTFIPFSEAMLFAGPFPYVWTKGGAIYRVAADVDLDFVAHLTKSPMIMVPPGKMKDAGAGLIKAARGRGVSLPRNEVFGLPTIETPRIVLRLQGDALNTHGELIAFYRTNEVSLIPLPRAPVAEAGRDLDLEARAMESVRAAGLVHDEPDADPEAPPLSEIHISGENAVAFWQSGLGALREATDPALEIQLSPALARVHVGAPLAPRVHVVLEGNWLKAKLEFASDDLKVELETIRRALEQKHQWVVLSDGTLSRISKSIEELADEAAEVMGGKSEARLPAHQLGRLDRWIEENDGRTDAAMEKLRSRLRALAVAAEPAMPKKLNATLRPYQKLGLAWLQFIDALGAGGILGDDMGLGKTITTLAFLQKKKEAEGKKPSLVVCPTSVATNWASESARFTPGLRVVVLHGPSRDVKQIAKADVVVTTYGLLRRDIEALSAVDFRCVVLDEAQNIKNAANATTRAANRLKADMRLALSGTPMENRLSELWSLASFANPGILGTPRLFERRFERPIASDRSSPLTLELRSIVRPFLLRRTKRDVLEELPPKTEINRIVSLSSADRRMYDALALSLREALKIDIEKRGLRASTLSAFTAITRLRQMACDPRLIDKHISTTTSAKREAFLDLVRELVAEGRRALVFSQFVELLTLWRKDLEAENISYAYLDGSTTKRDQVVARFQEGSAPLFLISLKAGGAGLNLTAADTVIHCDPWWNPAVEDQATDRAHRIGQNKAVTVVRLIAKGTIEEKILSLKATKRELTNAVIGDDARALAGITAEDIHALLGSAGEEPIGIEAEDLTDVLATDRSILDPEFTKVAKVAQRWHRETGLTEDQLATTVEIPVEFASRLLRGEPFPCSRAVAERIRSRIREW